MDSLLVLRRPLNGPKAQPASIKTAKAKKGVKKNPRGEVPPADPELAMHDISFVKLYNELCVGGRGDREHTSSPRTADATTEMRDARERVFSKSVDSVLRAYIAQANNIKFKSPPKVNKRRVTAEVVLELGYDRKNTRYHPKTKRKSKQKGKTNN